MTNPILVNSQENNSVTNESTRQALHLEPLIAQTRGKEQIKHTKQKILSQSRSRVIKSTQLSMQLLLLINVKMPTIVGILTFIISIITSFVFINMELVLLISVQVPTKREKGSLLD